MKRTQKLFIAGLLLLGGLALAVYWFPGPFLDPLGRFLVYEDSLVPADAIVVLAGSYSGNRMRKGVELYRRGFGKFLVFSGYEMYPGVFTHVAMKNYALKLGVPEENILTRIAGEERSTWGEARSNLALLEKAGARSFILVTSNFHTRRARRLYSILLKETRKPITFQVAAAPDPLVPIPGWWQTRSGRKMVFLEYIKTLNSYLEHG